MRFIGLVTAMCLAACGGAGGDDGGDDGGGDDDVGDPFAARMGTIEITESLGNWNGEAEPDAGGSAVLVDGPANPFHRETAREGECRLLEWAAGSSCPQPCDGICTIEGCVAFPDYLDAGDIAITGTNEPHVFETGNVDGRYGGLGLLTEIFATGATITATAAGGADVDAFELSTTAPAPIATSFATPLVLADEDTAITWTPADDGAVFLELVSANSGHGAPYDAIILCASADDGTITVPGAFIAALGPLTGRPCVVGHECPPARLVRYHQSSTETSAGTVVLRATTSRTFYIQH
jgi:hypothetical protein